MPCLLSQPATRPQLTRRKTWAKKQQLALESQPLIWNRISNYSHKTLQQTLLKPQIFILQQRSLENKQKNLAIQMRSLLKIIFFFAYANYESPPMWIRDVVSVSLYNWRVWQAPTAPLSASGLACTVHRPRESSRMKLDSPVILFLSLLSFE